MKKHKRRLFTPPLMQMFFSITQHLNLAFPEIESNTITNKSADLSEILLLVQEWLIRLISEGETDVYIFFAGHESG